MKKFISEFKTFIKRGNVLDLAVALIVGNAFTTIVNSLVNDVIMPFIRLLTKNGVAGLCVVLNNVPITLPDGSLNPNAIIFNYGNFLQAVINFFVIAFTVFVILKVFNAIHRDNDSSQPS